MEFSSLLCIDYLWSFSFNRSRFRGYFFPPGLPFLVAFRLYFFTLLCLRCIGGTGHLDLHFNRHHPELPVYEKIMDSGYINRCCTALYNKPEQRQWCQCQHYCINPGLPQDTAHVIQNVRWRPTCGCDMAADGSKCCVTHFSIRPKLDGNRIDAVRSQRISSNILSFDLVYVV